MNEQVTKINMKINALKTKSMTISKEDRKHNIIKGQTMEQVDGFRYKECIKNIVQ